MIHDFLAYPLPKSRQAYLNIKKWLRFILKKPSKKLRSRRKEII
jgi:hypothetical protein